jgi:DNA-binding CsgD family transcriptional regulator
VVQLTAQQTEVTRLLRRGLTSQEIAIQLGITRRTVEAHRFQMRRRESTMRHQPSCEAERIAPRSGGT